MKKISKVMSLILAFSISSCVLAGCKKDNKDKDRDRDSITTRATRDEQPSETDVPVDTSVAETTETTETTIDETYPIPDVVNETEAIVFHKFIESINEFNSYDDGSLRYAFINDYNPNSEVNWGLLVGYADNAEFDEYQIDEEGNVSYVRGYETYNMTYTYDDIMQFPVMNEMYFTTDDDNVFSDSIEDGTYYGNIYAFSLNGSRAFVSLADPIIISAEEYNSLQPGDHISIADNDPSFTRFYDLTVSDSYNPDSDSFEMFDGECWFVEREDGSYILETSSDCVVTYNNRVMFIDIAPDCDITDNFQYLLEVDPHLYENNANNFMSTIYYYHFAQSEMNYYYPNYDNGWTRAFGILEPVTVENNTITSVELGWR